MLIGMLNCEGLWISIFIRRLFLRAHLCFRCDVIQPNLFRSHGDVVTVLGVSLIKTMCIFLGSLRRYRDSLLETTQEFVTIVTNSEQ